MSLILEALKKSERQRRLGESPSIGSPVMAVRRRRSLLPAIVGLIVIGLAVLWWLQQRGADEPPVSSMPNSAATLPAVVNAPAPAPAATQPERPADGTTFNDAPIAATPSQTAPSRRVARDPSAELRTKADVDQRRKVRDGELVVADPQAGRAATIKESEPVSAADPAALATAMASAGKPMPAPVKATDNKTIEAAVDAKSAQPTLAAPPTSVQPGGSALKLMWELPLATRSKLPEIKLSMHVFAADPTQRFAIINDERRAEGDEIDGMRLIEIRPDGLIFEFDNVRFVYPRGGR